MIELMITLGVLVIIGLVAVPNVQRMVERNRIVGTVEAVYAQLALAKGESYKRSEEIVVRVVDNGDGTWGVGVSDVAACDPLETDPAQADACTLPFTEADGSTTRVLRTINNTMYTASEVAAEDESGTTIQTFTFDPVRGAVSPAGKIKLDYQPSGRDYEVQVQVDAVGRLRICSPTGSSHVGRYTDTSCNA